MKVIRGYRTELDLNNEQRTACLKHAGVARWVYNWGLHRYQEEYQAGRPTPNAFSLQKELVTLKQTETPWMYEVSKCCGQEALRDLEQAFKRFFKRCQLKKAGQYKGKLGYPRFKSRKRGIGSFRLKGTIHVYDNVIQLPRLGHLRLKERGYLPTSGVKILSATVSEQAGLWYVSVLVEQEVQDPQAAQGPAIGVDLGIKRMATLSDGTQFENPQALRKRLKALRRVSRRHSRKVKGSQNRKKAARRLAKMHARIANIRRDAIQKATTTIVAKTKLASVRPSCIVIEDLNINGMLKNRRLARAAADVSMYEVRRELTYKAQWAGSRLKIANRWYPSSKTCSCCGWINEDLTLKDRVFVCLECGYVADRDYNAAKGLATLA